MDVALNLNLVSSICWEIIAKQTIPLNVGTLPLFKLLLDSVYDFSSTIFERDLRIYWRYSQEGYLEITDYISLCAFLNLMVEPNLYLVIGDAEKFYCDTEKFLKILDLKELKRVKELERNKYDLRSEVEEIAEQIEQCQEALNLCSSSSLISEDNNDTNILRFALRNMPMGRCYTADICSGYSLIDCVRKVDSEVLHNVVNILLLTIAGIKSLHHISKAVGSEYPTFRILQPKFFEPLGKLFQPVLIRK